MIKVTIWNEFCHEKTNEEVHEKFPDGMHEHLKRMLACDDFEIRTAWLEKDEEHGLSEDVLNDTDVLLWWGHARHGDVRDDVVARVVEHVRNGMGFIALHSAHHSKPFRALMGTSCSLQWNSIDQRAHVWTVKPTHPIAQGVPLEFTLDVEEMYGEYFDIPDPDDLIFVTWYQDGHVFRGGCTFTRSAGKIFYFHPGHETGNSFFNPNVIRVIKNAIYWAKPIEKKNYRASECVEPLEEVR